MIRGGVRGFGCFVLLGGDFKVRGCFRCRMNSVVVRWRGVFFSSRSAVCCGGVRLCCALIII